jgi:hypothetical protein
LCFLSPGCAGSASHYAGGMLIYHCCPATMCRERFALSLSLRHAHAAASPPDSPPQCAGSAWLLAILFSSLFLKYLVKALKSIITLHLLKIKLKRLNRTCISLKSIIRFPKTILLDSSIIILKKGWQLNGGDNFQNRWGKKSMFIVMYSQ